MLSGLRSSGTIDMRSIHVGGSVLCSGTTLLNTPYSLRLESCEVNHDFVFDQGSSSLGAIGLDLSTIKGQVKIDSSHPSSLSCRGMKAGEFRWLHILSPDKTRLNLSGAHIGRFHDESGSWPAHGALVISGMIVEDMEPSPVHRIAWLERQSKEHRVEPQPWFHLAKHLRERGHYKEAKHAIFKLRGFQARANHQHGPLRLFGLYWKLAVAALEEKPQRIVWSIIVCVMIGTSLFYPCRAHFSETSNEAYIQSHSGHKSSTQAIGAYPAFNPVIYSLENTLPVIRLGQDDKWAPDPRGTAPLLYWSLAGMRWFLILAGWTQGIVLAAALDARFRAQ